MSALSDRRPPFVRLTHAFGRVFLPFMTRVHLDGLDRVDLPRTGPLLITSNHLSNADPGLVASWLSPALGRQFHWLGKEESLHWPILGWAIAQNGVIGVKRGSGDIEAFRTARRVLDEGLVLVVFPEGTRSRTGALQVAKDGVAILAMRSGATILPVAVHGTETFWPRGSFMKFRTGEIHLSVGAPYRLPSYEELDRREAQSAATREIMRRIAELLPERYRGAYGGPADDPGAARAYGPHGEVSAPPVT